MENAGLLLALLIPALFIGLGILFDIIGVVDAADPRPFTPWPPTRKGRERGAEAPAERGPGVQRLQ